LVAPNDNEEHPCLLKNEQWVQVFLSSVLEEQESAGMRRTVTAPGGGMVLNKNCQRMT
jgi:hypothetical protein